MSGSILHYIDNEVENLGEWDSVVEEGSSTLVQGADGAWPERGVLGLRAAIVGNNNEAYAQKTLSYALPAGGTFYLGFWIRQSATPGNYGGRTVSLWHPNGVTRIMQLRWSATNAFHVYYYPDTGGVGTTSFTFVNDRWYYVVMGVKRATTSEASDGEAWFYVDGVEVDHDSDVDNYDTFATIGILRAGVAEYSKDGHVLDVDEIKVAAAYPEPFVPAPETVYCEPRRTVVLYRTGNSDSRSFADYCVEQLGVPRANLCPLPNASGDETLTSDGIFQSQVESSLYAWLGRNPTVNANKMCFLLGYGVPAYFTRNTVLLSGASRLMHYNSGLVKTGNPFWGRTTRITKSELDAAGLFMAARVDADTLEHAKDIIDAGLVVSNLPALPDADYLMSDDSGFLGSLSAQKTRLRRDGDYATDPAAMMIGDIDEVGGVASSGTRAAICDEGTALTTLRSQAAYINTALLVNGYASGLGFSALPADGFDGEAFLEMLLAGGTFAEAAMVAVEHVDHTAVPAGPPTMTVAFGLAGYNVYHGLGGPEAIDWTSPVACPRPDEQQPTVTLNLPSGEKHVLAARAVSKGGIEEHNTHVLTYAIAGQGGALLGAPLPTPTDVVAVLQTDGAVLLGFSCHPLPGMDATTTFEVITDNGTGVMDTENPVATISASGLRETDFEVLVVPENLPARFAARARRDDDVSPLSPTVRVLPAYSPDPPAVL